MNSTPSESHEPKKVKAIPFKLWFVTKKEPGRSDIQIGKPLNYAAVLTPKFYTLSKLHYNNVDEKIKKLVSKYPKEKYDLPITQNQTYGWYQNNFNQDPFVNEILNFRKVKKRFIEEHLMGYEKIRD